MDRFRLGLIGAGTWAIAQHLPAFVARDDIEPLIVCRRDADLVEQVAEHFGFERATTDWHEVIEARPDLIVISGPVVQRPEMVRAALEAGAHVLAEKPFALDPADAWELTALAEEKGLTLMLAYAWNFVRIVEEARRLLAEDGGVGKIEHVTLTMSNNVRDLLIVGRQYHDLPIDSPPRLETWGDPKISGGGYGHGQLTHGLGVMFRVVPLRATGAMALMSSREGVPVELHDAIAVRLDGGATAMVSGASLPVGTFDDVMQLQLRVTGERGQLLVDIDRPLVRRSRGEEDDVTLDLGDTGSDYSFATVVDRFVDLAAGRITENRAPGELGARVVEVLDAAYRSAESGRLEAVARD